MPGGSLLFVPAEVESRIVQQIPGAFHVNKRENDLPGR